MNPGQLILSCPDAVIAPTASEPDTTSFPLTGVQLVTPKIALNDKMIAPDDEIVPVSEPDCWHAGTTAISESGVDCQLPAI